MSTAYLIVSVTLVTALVVYAVITMIIVIGWAMEKPEPKFKNDLPELIERFDNEITNSHK